MTVTLAFAERPADGNPAGLLVLHHGRGSDELDLLGLGDALDPGHRLHIVSPRAPLQLAGAPGNHWYVVPRVGFPDPATFADAFAALSRFHDATWERTGLGPGQTVLGGFSQGSVMSYALGLPADRPVPRGLLIFSGFIPTVSGWAADPAPRRQLQVFVVHGRADPVIDVAFGRRSVQTLRDDGLEVEYLESDHGHSITPAGARAAQAWLGRTFAGAA